MSTITQYNFKIEEALKEKIEEVLEKTDLNKGELLEKMLQSYEIQLSTIDTNIDFKEIDFLSQKDKEAFQKAFLYGIRKIEENTSRTKQEYIYIDTEKKSLIEKEELQKAEMEKVKLEYLEKFNTFENEIKKLSSSLSQKDTQLKELQIELSRVSKVSEQVEFISNENTSLRLDLKTIEKEKKDIEATNQKAISSLELSMKKAIEKVENEKKDIQISRKKELHSVQVELKNIETSHKKEILDCQEHTKTIEQKYQKEVSTLNETILKYTFEVEKKTENIDRVEKNNVELQKSIKSLSITHTKDIQALQKKYDSDIASMKKELDSLNRELYTSLGKLEVLQEKEEQKETQKVTPTKKEEKSLFDNEKKK